MDAATELTGTYWQRVLRWWAGKGPAENTQRRVRSEQGSLEGGTCPTEQPQPARSPSNGVVSRCYLRAASLASRVARNSESWLQFGH
ncbi:hypothetical protein BRM08_03490 [Xanthomonas oryzae pv. oryzae]|nr:hypothetical protein BRN32_21280 [Xanthomonas oryzae pv. oryzae]AXQ76718.1 hypothetical protein BXU03_21345 [Xanthomonas oryzae pv. oryzae]QEJ70137.1 hypothetical protein BXO1_021420 [Xanthomonas oryzae pv. oryzae]RBC19164.1 hypothetical protein BRN26_22475 [Xanthomonas oryzae pv. oryzae]RBC24539.1 hypothetical protein BRN28_15655 [Xanthomonas oryzae pv. oryzae]